MSNRSIAEQHERSAEEEGLEPLKAWFCELANEIIEREFSGGDEIEFAWVDEQEVDPVKQKDVLTGYVEAGVMSLNEAREKLGLSPDPNPAASKLAAMTATGYVPVGDFVKSEDNVKGEDKNGMAGTSTSTASRETARGK